MNTPYPSTRTHTLVQTDLASERGFEADSLDSVPLTEQPGVRFRHQARIHPRKYLAGLANAFVALGGRIHEHSEAADFTDSPRSVDAVIR